MTHRRSPAEQRFDELKARTHAAMTNQNELPLTHRPAEHYRRTNDAGTETVRTVCICGWVTDWEWSNTQANWHHLMHRLQQLAAE